MELDASQLYADKTWVCTSLAMSDAEKKALLFSAKEYGESLAILGLKFHIEKLASGSMLRWGGNKGLLIAANFESFEFQGIFTINQFANACVVSVYKQWLGDSFFMVNHSAEARRRVVIDKLQSLELIDYFYLVDYVIDKVSDFLTAALNEMVELR